MVIWHAPGLVQIKKNTIRTFVRQFATLSRMSKTLGHNNDEPNHYYRIKDFTILIEDITGDSSDKNTYYGGYCVRRKGREHLRYLFKTHNCSYAVTTICIKRISLLMVYRFFFQLLFLRSSNKTQIMILHHTFNPYTPVQPRTACYVPMSLIPVIFQPVQTSRQLSGEKC